MDGVFYLRYISYYYCMFWFLFIFFILVAAGIGMVFEFFEQMKESEYEIVRILYWVLVVSFWVYVFIWLINL
jgi:hypothetical protein